jgi:hypothetical protein
MSRKVTKRMRKHVQEEVDPLVKVFLITLHHEDLATPIRASSDATQRFEDESDEINVIYGTISNGLKYYYTGFDASLANDEDGAAPQVQVTMPNASRVIIEAIESMGAGPVTVDLQLVFADTPDVVELELNDMEMSDITYDETSISGVISRDLLFNEPFPFRSFTPKDYPFLFSTRTSM